MFQLYKSDKIRFIAGLILILIIYSLYYLYFTENKYIVQIPRKWRHVIKFITTVAVYIVGSIHLGRIKEQWMNGLWHMVHISLLGTITLIGLYDWSFGMVSLPTKEMAASFQEFLISPLLYIGMGILNYRSQ